MVQEICDGYIVVKVDVDVEAMHVVLQIFFCSWKHCLSLTKWRRRKKKVKKGK